MYDFTNLSDVEFERLCGDILSRELGVKLRYFKPGRDGGIDLVDDTAEKNIVVQVKHYSRSSFSSLLGSLKKEVNKVQTLNPKQYYICVSQELTALNITEIYNLFSDYMDSTSNIITKYELVSFLNEGRNQDILRKNYKLWLLSDKLLKDIFNNQIFIDSEVLLDDIEEDFRYFVQTEIFNEALETIKKHRILMLFGAPGVGKSINSKMLAAAFVKEDYIIRYTTDGQVSNIKKVISENPDVKEVILLDDCLGQYYFNLKKGQDRELISFIKYIMHHKNKILILNTRVTILNEAKRTRSEFRYFLDEKKIPLKTIDMEAISLREKAEIFYNHLLRNKIPKPYFEAIRLDKEYKKITNHSNYNPRIIEFVTKKYRYSEINPEDYSKYILKNLINPKEVWADEFDEKLDEYDRIFMHTLFSLTDTSIEIDILKECFIFRLEIEGRAQSTIDHFSVVKIRLTKSLVRIFDVHGKQMIGVLNPSINDFMNNHLKSNTLGRNAIRESIIYIEQLEKMLQQKEAEEILFMKLNSGDFSKFKSFNDKNITFLYYGIAKFKILKDDYKQIIKNNFNKLNQSEDYFNIFLTKVEIVTTFLQEKDLFEFYSIGEYLENESFIDNLLIDLNLEEISEVSSVINSKRLSIPGLPKRLHEFLLVAIDQYLNDIEIYDCIDELNGFDIIYDLKPLEENKDDIDEVIKELNLDIRKSLKQEIIDILNGTFDLETINDQLDDLLEFRISEGNIVDVIDSIFNPEPDFDYADSEDLLGYDSGNIDGTDLIFEREIEYDN